jgi:DNA polymerase-3 subunit delta
MSSRLSPPQLRRALAKAPPAAAYYLHGGEGILKDEAQALILDTALEPSLRDFNLDILSAQQVGPENLVSVCSSLPMMAERRVVVVRDVESWKRKTKAKQAAVTYLQRPSPETVLVLVQGGDGDADDDLTAHCVTVNCTALTGDALDEWLDARMAQVGVTITPDAREHLIRATAGELGLLAAEIAKLSGLAEAGPIDRETVSSLVGVRFGETPDDWRDAVLRDDIAAAIRLVPRLLETTGNSGVRLASLLGTSFIALRWARATADETKARGSALAERVKKLCFEVRPQVGSYGPFANLIAEVTPRWSQPRLRTAIAATLAADIALKGTTISDETGIMTDLVLTLATTASRKAA